MSLIKPRLVAIDSSHWTHLARAASSPSSAMRKKARRLPEQLLDQGYILTLTWHHVEELLSVDDDALAEARLGYIMELPFLAWVGGVIQNEHPGSIVEIVAAEVIALRDGTVGLTEVRDHAKARLFQTGTGEEALGPDRWIWRVLRPSLIERNRDARRLTALAPAQFINGSTTVGSLLEGRIRSLQEARPLLEAMARALSRDIAVGGDLRIEDPAAMATEFLGEVAEMAPWRAGSVWNFIIQTSVARGLDADEITPDMTIDQIGELCVFRSKLRIVAEAIGCEWDALRRTIRMEDCPHWVLETELRRHRQAGLRRSGSDLNDGCLAVLSAYVDELYVDRRVAENFLRARRGSPRLKALAGDVRKASTVFDIPAQLV